MVGRPLHESECTLILHPPGVIGTQTVTNHIMETQLILGIEAARATVIHELSGTMKAYGLVVDPRHMMLLGDIMSFKGEILGITRFGIAKMKDSVRCSNLGSPSHADAWSVQVLMLASFERTTDHIFLGALHSKRDPIEGVSESIIMGNPADIGTSACVN